MTEHISFPTFEAAFPPSDLRVEFDWLALRQGMEDGIADITIDHVTTWDPTKLYAPWYHDGHRQAMRYDEEGAQPWRYDQLLGQPMMQVPGHFLSEEIIARHDAVFKDAKILSHDVGEERHLVLDGNHRLILRLGFLAARQIVLPHYQIHAPLNPPLVPDVKHFT
ncbi:MAG TPA: hypothetical protein VJ841_00155 [Candidatus Saccharimonadales bacterium]|nr:hypothetical protein [Candidatus Saccharimonadales bacterium]